MQLNKTSVPFTKELSSIKYKMLHVGLGLGLSHCPVATARFAADGNCFIQSASPGSQRTSSVDHSVLNTIINRSNVILPWIPQMAIIIILVTSFDCYDI